VSVTEPPAQKVVAPDAVMAAAGRSCTVTVTGAEAALQPFASVTVTVESPASVTSIDRVVAPFDQRYDAPAEAVSVTLPPVQNVVGPDAVITGTARAWTVTLTGALVAVQPFAASVTVTVNDPLALTAIDRVVAPFDHSHDAPSDAVSVTLPPAQNVVLPVGVIDAGAAVCTVTTVAADVAEQPETSVTCTE
jgi:hypothetical protein